MLSLLSRSASIMNSDNNAAKCLPEPWIAGCPRILLCFIEEYVEFTLECYIERAKLFIGLASILSFNLCASLLLCVYACAY